jgi:hypothetical protein
MMRVFIRKPEDLPTPTEYNQQIIAEQENRRKVLGVLSLPCDLCGVVMSYFPMLPTPLDLKEIWDPSYCWHLAMEGNCSENFCLICCVSYMEKIP